MSFGPVRVRGIYATALTKLLIELGVPIAEPSVVIAERLGITGDPRPAVTRIQDRADHQGIELHGEPAAIQPLLDGLLRRFPRSVPRPANGAWTGWSLEFPGSVKTALDDIRRSVIPTIQRHHQLKAVSPHEVDQAEETLRTSPERFDEISLATRNHLLEGEHLRSGTRFVVQHAKPAGQTYDLKGEVGTFTWPTFRLNRRFHPGGTYDSLDVPRQRGDFGYLDIELDSGISVRRYYRASGEHLGDLYNLATEAELYPGHIRYVDLELDVLHMPGQAPRVVDEADLERAHARGFLSAELVEDAWAMARHVIAGIESEG